MVHLTTAAATRISCNSSIKSKTSFQVWEILNIQINARKLSGVFFPTLMRSFQTVRSHFSIFFPTEEKN